MVGEEVLGRSGACVRCHFVSLDITGSHMTTHNYCTPELLLLHEPLLGWDVVCPRR
jgi:hypothetical protein